VLLSGGPDIHRVIRRVPAPGWGQRGATSTRPSSPSPARRLRPGCRCFAISRRPGAEHRRGGTLFQHLPEQFGRAIQHRQLADGPGSTHPVEIDPTAPRSLARVHRAGRQLLPPPVHQRPWPGCAVAWADGVVRRSRCRAAHSRLAFSGMPSR
jgi:hypothetical protein